MNEKCLPGLYPEDVVSADCPESEKKVHKALKDDLPPNWYAWHSLKVRTKEGKFGEADFLVADPNRGLLVVEVKGGQIRKERGMWYTYDKELKPPPFKQAHRFKTLLLEVFKEKHIHSPGIGVALCLSDTSFSDQPTQADIQDLVVGENHLPYMDKILPDLMENIPVFGITRGGWIKALHEMWCESWIPEMNLLTRVKAAEERRLAFDKEQFMTLCSVYENDRVLVLGGAGTGKTILARELAKKEAKEGKRVLLLSFTLALGSSLASEFSEPDVTATSIGKFAVDLLRGRGKDIRERYEPDFWENITLEAALEGLSREDKIWDTVIVDEGQDMGENEWGLIEECVRGDKRIWVFMDPAQAFWEERKIPESLMKEFVKYTLRKPYRCPSGIQALADGYVGKDADRDCVREAVADGIVRILRCKESAVHKRVGDAVNELLDEGFKEPEIAVLSLRGMGFEENIMHRGELGGHAVKKATDPGAESHIICDSFLRFKGLERPAVIVTDLRYVVDKYEVRMNIAVSRAVSVLRIVGAEVEIEKDEMLRGLG
jgi:hypothetical protein